MKQIIFTTAFFISVVTAFAQRFELLHPSLSEMKVSDLAATPDGKYVFFTDGQVVYRYSAIDTETNLSTFYSTAAEPITALKVDHTNSTLAVAVGSKLLILNADNSVQLRGLALPGGKAHRMAFSKNGKSLALAHEDHRIDIIDMETGQLRYSLTKHTKYVSSLVFSQDNNFLISAGADKSIFVWNANTGTLAKTLSGHKNWVRALDISPDSIHLASIGDDRRVYIWNIRDSSTTYTQRGAPAHDNWATDLHYVPHGELISVGHDNFVVVSSSIRDSTYATNMQHKQRIFRQVEYQPDKVTIAGKYAVFVSTLGRGLHTDPYYQLNYRNAHPFKITNVDGRETNKMEAWFTLSRSAEIHFTIGDSESLQHMIIHNIKTNECDTIYADFESPRILQTTNEWNDYKFTLVNKDKHVKPEDYYFTIYYPNRSYRFFDEFKNRRRFVDGYIW